MEGDSQFGWPDYLVFCLFMSISVIIGFVAAYRNRNHRNVEEYLMADRNMPVIPVALSLFVTVCTSVSFLSDPVEVYKYGISYWALMLGSAICWFIVAHFFAPAFHKEQLTSTYEYLTSRYSPTLRSFASITVGIGTICYCGLITFAAALAFSQVSGLDVNVIVIGLVVISTLYTTVGGIKAVLWADSLQTTVIYAGLVALVVKGIMVSGGITEVWSAAQRGGRLDLWRFDFDLSVRSFPNYVIGGFFGLFCPCVSYQFVVQRYCVVRTPRDATISVYIQAPIYVSVIGMLGMTGLIMFAYFGECDPLTTGRIASMDQAYMIIPVSQMVPLMLLEFFGDSPGVPGLYMSSLCCAALSTVSSGQNALATNILKDLVEPLYRRFTHKLLSDRVSTIIAAVSTSIVGVIIGVTSILFMMMGNSIFLLIFVISGVFAGPIASLFVLGLYMPSLKTRSAVVGLISGILITGGMFAGATYYGVTYPSLPTSTHGCLSPNSTSNMSYVANNSTWESILLDPDPQGNTSDSQAPAIFRVYGVMYPVIGALTALSMAILTYLLTDKLPSIICKSDDNEKEEIHKTNEIIPLKSTQNTEEDAFVERTHRTQKI